MARYQVRKAPSDRGNSRGELKARLDKYYGLAQEQSRDLFYFWYLPAVGYMLKDFGSLICTVSDRLNALSIRINSFFDEAREGRMGEAELGKAVLTSVTNFCPDR